MSKTKLFHISSHPKLKNIKKGDTFKLKPGSQGAEGFGVYFSEVKPRPKAAEGANRTEKTGIIQIEPESSKGWWKSKGFKTRKFGKPRTWHSDGKNIKCKVKEITVEGVLKCSHSFE